MKRADRAALTVRIIEGAAGSGKTQRLVEHVRCLVADGAPTGDLLVVACSPMAAGRLRERIGCAGVEVVTMRDVALGVLADARAREVLGRGGRLLTGGDERVFFEAVKETGVSGCRLKEMLRFFFRSWTELADWQPGWLVSKEEELVHAAAKEALARTDGVLECEAANLAALALDADGGLRERYRHAHVIVDDYTCCSHASQELAFRFAGSSLCVAGDDRESVEVYDSYPARSGLTWLAGMCPQARVERAEPQEGETARMRTLAMAMDAGHGALEDGLDVVSPLVAQDADDELMLVVREVHAALDGGTEPGDVFVSAPTWARARALADALRAEEVSVAAVADDATLGGGFRRVPLPSLSCDTGSVNVGMLQQVRGLSPRLLIVTGFVNGAYPDRNFFDLGTSTPDHVERVFQAEARVFYGAMCPPDTNVTVTSFEYADPAWAQRNGLDVTRVRMRNGKPQARIATSLWARGVQDAG